MPALLAVRRRTIGLGLAAASVMSARGFAADLSLTHESGSTDVAVAFVAGARLTYLVLASFAAQALLAAVKTGEPARMAGGKPQLG